MQYSVINFSLKLNNISKLALYTCPSQHFILLLIEPNRAGYGMFNSQLDSKSIKVRFWRGSNSRPSACKADVITTTPQNPQLQR